MVSRCWRSLVLYPHVHGVRDWVYGISRITIDSRIDAMITRTTKRAAETAKTRTPSGAARTLIIPKKTGPISAKHIRDAVAQVFAKKPATRS